MLHSAVGAPLFAADSTDDMEILDEEDLKLTLPLLGKRQANALLEENNSFLDDEFSPPSVKQARFSIDPGN